MKADLSKAEDPQSKDAIEKLALQHIQGDITMACSSCPKGSVKAGKPEILARQASGANAVIRSRCRSVSACPSWR